MKKVVSAICIAMVVIMCVFSGCTNDEKFSGIKIGLICLHDENATYDKNFISGFNKACSETGATGIIKTNIPEGQECYDAACELVDQGCSVIFADSFGHEDYMIQASKEFPDVQFCHATGTQAHTCGLSNFHNAFASIYDGRFLAGVVGGMKLNEMILNGEISADEARVGYIGAFTYAEVISGYTSFFLGVRYICPSAFMDVTFTGSWYDETAEKEAANKLISNGCVLISQHADSMGAPTACETAGVYNVSYNGSTLSACPNTYLISSRIDWEPYFKLIITDTENIPTDYVGTLETGSVVLTELNTNIAAKDSENMIEEITELIKNGEFSVFNTKYFTVNGEMLTSYIADVDTDSEYTPDTEVIENGSFSESKFRSAPYFDLRIDGITMLDEVY